jgi:hypothetical protein
VSKFDFASVLFMQVFILVIFYRVGYNKGFKDKIASIVLDLNSSLGVKHKMILRNYCPTCGGSGMVDTKIPNGGGGAVRGQ